MNIRKPYIVLAALATVQIAAATCLSSCPFVPFDQFSADPTLNVRLVPTDTVSASELQAFANAANNVISGTSISARYEVGQPDLNVTPVEVRLITDPSFFTTNTDLEDSANSVAFLDKKTFTQPSGERDVVSAVVYINLTAKCGTSSCLNSQLPNYDTAIRNLMMHEGIGHLFGLQDATAASSMMGPGNGAVNDITSNRAPNACDVAALEMRKTNYAQGGNSCGILAL